jgi:hypothetical protein
MQAIISVISGMIGFVIAIGMQLNMLLYMKISSANSQLAPTVYSVGMETKILIMVLGAIAIVCSILYSRTNKYKLRIINRVGMLLGIIAILLCFIPLYLMVY